MLLNFSRPNLFRILTALAAILLLAVPACKRGKIVTQHEYMYVSAPESSLRDRVATMYNKVSTVHNGDRVEVLERVRRFVRVRTDQGAEGWIEQRSLVSQEVFDGFQKLVADSRDQAVQGHGTTRAELNMHLTPSRDGEHLYQLKEGEKVEVLKRATTDKNAPKAAQTDQPTEDDPWRSRRTKSRQRRNPHCLRRHPLRARLRLKRRQSLSLQSATMPNQPSHPNQ